MSLDVAKFKRDTIELSRRLHEISQKSFKNPRTRAIHNRNGDGHVYRARYKPELQFCPTIQKHCSTRFFADQNRVFCIAENPCWKETKKL